MKNNIRYILLPAFIGIIIFIGTCLLGAEEIPEMPTGLAWDKLAHFGMFFTLSAINYIDYYLMCKGEFKVGRWVLWGFIIPVIYGGIIELLQKYFFVTRSAELADFIADILGSLAATLVAIYFIYRQRKLKKNISL